MTAALRLYCSIHYYIATTVCALTIYSALYALSFLLYNVRRVAATLISDLLPLILDGIHLMFE